MRILTRRVWRTRDGAMPLHTCDVWRINHRIIGVFADCKKRKRRKLLEISLSITHPTHAVRCTYAKQRRVSVDITRYGPQSGVAGVIAGPGVTTATCNAGCTAAAAAATAASGGGGASASNTRVPAAAAAAVRKCIESRSKAG